MVGLQEERKNNQGTFINLFPYIDEEMVNVALEELKIDKKIKTSNSTCRKNSFIYFLLLPWIIGLSILLPMMICFVFSYYIVSIVLLIVYVVYALLVLLFGHIRMKNQSIDFDNDNLYFSCGCVTCSHFVIPWTSVVSIGTTTTFLREKNGIVSVVISYYADKIKATKVVSMQDIKTYGELLLFFESIKNK